MKASYYFLILLATVFIGFIGQGFLRNWLDNRGARLVSENFELISLSRLQWAKEQKGKIVILGSSRTERLMPSEGIVVVGVPGSSFVAGLDFIDPALIAPGTTFILEGNHLLSGCSDFMADTRRPWFRIGEKWKCFSYASRPSSLVVSLIEYALKGSDFAAMQNATPFDEVGERIRALLSVSVLNMSSLGAVIDNINHLKASGANVCIAFYPSVGDETDEEKELFQAVCKTAISTDTPLLDYRKCMNGLLAYSDATHLVSTDPRTFRFRNTLVRDAQIK